MCNGDLDSWVFPVLCTVFCRIWRQFCIRSQWFVTLSFSSLSDPRLVSQLEGQFSFAFLAKISCCVTWFCNNLLRKTLKCHGNSGSRPDLSLAKAEPHATGRPPRRPRKFYIARLSAQYSGSVSMFCILSRRDLFTGKIDGFALLILA